MVKNSPRDDTAVIGICMGKVYGIVPRANSAFSPTLGRRECECPNSLLMDNVTVHRRKEELCDQRLPTITYHYGHQLGDVFWIPSLSAND